MNLSSGMQLPELDFIQDIEDEAPKSDVATGWETVIFLLEDDDGGDG